MIIYGYSLDIHKIPKKILKEFESIKQSNITFETCYSVSSYEPEACVLGIVLDTTSFLFNPVSIKKCIIKPTKDQIKDLQNIKLSEKALEYLSKKKPKVFILEESDD